MNAVHLIGRLTKDPELKNTQSDLAMTSITIAIDRGKDRDGQDKGADFPRVQVFGKTAENVCKFCEKGRLIGVEGRIQTGSYEKQDGTKVYTTDVVANRIEFLEWAGKKEQNAEPQNQDGFVPVDEDDIPF